MLIRTERRSDSTGDDMQHVWPWRRPNSPPDLSIRNTSCETERAAAAAAVHSRPEPTVRVPSLSSATRDYARAVAMRTFDRLDARDLTRLHVAMGPELWAWQRARRLTTQMPWRASPTMDEGCERTRARSQMTEDIATWERALAEVDADSRRAQLFGSAPPLPLEVPAAVMAVIEARRAAALARMARRRPGTAEGGSGPALAPDDPMRQGLTPK